MKNRNRQFQSIRRSHIHSQISDLSSVRSVKSIQSSVSQTTLNFNHHQNSNQNYYQSFLKKDKNVCVTCINKTLVKHKMDQKEKEMQIEHAAYQQTIRQMQEYRDLKEEERQKMKIESMKINSQMMEQHKMQSQHQRQSDVFMMKNLCEKQKQIDFLLTSKTENQKKEEAKFRKQLYQQYLEQLKKKQIAKINKKIPEINQLPLKNNDLTEMKQQYLLNLQRQIQDNYRLKQQQKEKKNEEEKYFLEFAQKDALKYTQFSRLKQKEENPEIFEELHLLDYMKRNQKLEKIENQNEERVQKMKRERNQNRRAIEEKMKKMSVYVSELRKQVVEKKMQKKQQKEEEKAFIEKERLFTEDISKRSRILKECEDCHSCLEEKFITSQYS